MPRRSHHRELEIGGVDIRDVAGCSCQRLRKAARRMTQLYEQSMEPTGLTIGQFGVLANLFGSLAMGEAGVSVGTLADRLGVDPTTLKRTLAPLVADGLVAAGPAPDDRRVRLLRQTDAGGARLAAAIPRWREAQARLETALGGTMKDQLDHAVEAAYEKMRASG